MDEALGVLNSLLRKQGPEGAEDLDNATSFPSNFPGQRNVTVPSLAGPSRPSSASACQLALANLREIRSNFAPYDRIILTYIIIRLLIVNIRIYCSKTLSAIAIYQFKGYNIDLPMQLIIMHRGLLKLTEH